MLRPVCLNMLMMSLSLTQKWKPQSSINAIMTSFGDYFSAAVQSINQDMAKIVLFHRHVQPKKMEIIVGDIKEANSTESEPIESLRSWLKARGSHMNPLLLSWSGNRWRTRVIISLSKCFNFTDIIGKVVHFDESHSDHCCWPIQVVQHQEFRKPITL